MYICKQFLNKYFYCSQENCQIRKKSAKLKVLVVLPFLLLPYISKPGLDDWSDQVYERFSRNGQLLFRFIHQGPEFKTSFK